MIRILIPVGDMTALMTKISAHTGSELASDCEPSGYEIVVAVHPAFGAEAVLNLGGRTIPLGAATIALEGNE